MSVICGQLCQHPACWKASIDLIRHCHLQKLLESGGYNENLKDVSQETNVCAWSKQQKNFSKFTVNPPQKKEETTLPKLNVLTLDATSEAFGLLGKFTRKCATKSGETETEVSDKVESVPEDSSWSRDLTEKKIPFQATLKSNELSSSLLTSHGSHYEKVLVWVPSKRGKKTVRTVPPGTLGLQLINGDCLPCVFWQKNSVKLTARARSSGSKAHGYKRAQRFSSIDQDLLDSHWSEVCLPSPLKTAPLRLHSHATDEDDAKVAMSPAKILDNKAAPNDIILSDATAEHSVLEQVNQVSAASRNIQDFQEHDTGSPKRDQKKRSYLRERVSARPVLPLTKVSVPKRQMRRCQVFGPCTAVKRRVDLSDVFMKPLSRSENNSVASLDSLTKSSEQVKWQSHQEHIGVHTCKTPITEPQSRCFPSQIHFPAPRPSSSSRHEFFIPLSISAPLQAAEKVASPCSAADTVESYEHDEHRSVAVNCTVAFPSRLDGLCNTSSKAQPCLLHPPMLSESSASTITGNRSCGSLTTATSMVSKVISEADQYITARAYDKYSSFLSFQTPESSRHILEPISQEGVACQHLEESSLLSPPLQTCPQPRLTPDLNRQYSPENIGVRPRRSSPTPGSSPSPSTDLHQLKQPSSPKPPEELTVSRMNLGKQPSRCSLRRRPRSVDAAVLPVERDRSFDRAPPSSPENFVAGSPSPIRSLEHGSLRQILVSAVVCNGDDDPIDIPTADNENDIPYTASPPELIFSVRTSLNEEEVDGAGTDVFYDNPISNAINATGISVSYDSLNSRSYDSLNSKNDDNENYVGNSKSTVEYDYIDDRVKRDQIVSDTDGRHSFGHEAGETDMPVKIGSSRNSSKCVNESCPDISSDLSSRPSHEYEMDVGRNFRHGSTKAELRDLPGVILNPAFQTGLQKDNRDAAERDEETRLPTNSEEIPVHTPMLTSELRGFQGSLLRSPTPRAELYQRPSSPYFDSTNIRDFTAGLNLDLNLEEEISKAMEGLEYLELSGDCLNIDSILSRK